MILDRECRARIAPFNAQRRREPPDTNLTGRVARETGTPFLNGEAGFEEPRNVARAILNPVFCDCMPDSQVEGLLPNVKDEPRRRLA